MNSEYYNGFVSKQRFFSFVLHVFKLKLLYMYVYVCLYS